MKGISGWNYRPYYPLNRADEKNNPFICRIAPSECSVTVEILDNMHPDSGHIINIRRAESCDEWKCAEMHGTADTVDGLTPDCDYELFVSRRDDSSAKSRTRLARTGFYPDTMVNYLHPKDDAYAFSGHYLCSPSFVRLPSGALLSSMDVYANNAPQNLTILFRSEDNGATWRYVCDLFPAYWGTLFVCNGVVYLLATTTENGNLIIGASYDEGYTWTKPSLLFTGGSQPDVCGCQREPMPIIHDNGYIRTCIEYGCWSDPKGFGVAVLSVKEDTDLLLSENWTMSDLTYYDMNWKGSPQGGRAFILEGSLYRAGDGKIVNLLRMTLSGTVPNYGKACILEIDGDDIEAAPKFHSIIDMPTGTNSRTHVLFDDVSGKYWAIGNLFDEPKNYVRSIMSLCVSDDGYNWRLVKNILDYRHLDVGKVGFQYTSFIFDGDDILYLSRTAFNEADNFHNANCQTFGVVSNFRRLVQ